MLIRTYVADIEVGQIVEMIVETNKQDKVSMIYMFAYIYIICEGGVML